MKNIIEKPILLVKYMKNNVSPYRYYTYPNLKLNELPSEDYCIDRPISQISTCSCGFHAVPIEGIRNWAGTGYPTVVTAPTGGGGPGLLGRFELTTEGV